VTAASLDAAHGDESADTVIAIGGTGCGRDDASVMALARAGRIEAHGVALSPGETTAFGMLGERPVLLLPGRIDAAAAAWLMLGRRLLLRLTGRNEAPIGRPARLSRKVASSLGLDEFVPVRLRAGKAEPIASGYVPLHALVNADGWILVPAASEGYPVDAEVVIHPWP
jgi:molybdopterin biosynthesis enzyme